MAENSWKGLTNSKEPWKSKLTKSRKWSEKIMAELLRAENAAFAKWSQEQALKRQQSYSSYDQWLKNQTKPKKGEV